MSTLLRDVVAPPADVQRFELIRSATSPTGMPFPRLAKTIALPFASDLSGETQTIYHAANSAKHWPCSPPKCRRGMQRALDLNHGIPPTYFTYRVEDYDVLPETDAQGRPFIRAKRFHAASAAAVFGRAGARLQGLDRRRKSARLYQQIKASPLFDRELKMYKVNASLADQPHDIGRARAFVPGWLENESIWLHMEYKYLLEVLRAGLYEEFFEDFKSALIPFLDPQTYGRSPLENSSFIVSSAHPDRSLHGAGFVARLSGSTAEFSEPLAVDVHRAAAVLACNDGELQLKFAARPARLVVRRRQGTITFKFLGQCVVTYHNPRRVDTFTAEAHDPADRVDRSGWRTDRNRRRHHRRTVGRADPIGRSGAPRSVSGVASWKKSNSLSSIMVRNPSHCLRSLLAEFEAKQRIRVHLTVMPFAGAWSAMVRMALYEDGPDVSAVGTSWVGDFVRMNALRPYQEAEVRALGERR